MPARPPQAPQSALRLIRTMSLTLYSTSACHLCELAKGLLKDSRVEFDEVDIADSDELFERYGLRIPVLKQPDGAELGWPFGPEELAAFLGG